MVDMLDTLNYTMVELLSVFEIELKMCRVAKTYDKHKYSSNKGYG